jgi:hypothetical protein
MSKHDNLRSKDYHLKPMVNYHSSLSDTHHLPISLHVFPFPSLIFSFVFLWCFVSFEIKGKCHFLVHPSSTPFPSQSSDDTTSISLEDSQYNTMVTKLVNAWLSELASPPLAFTNHARMMTDFVILLSGSANTIPDIHGEIPRRQIASSRKGSHYAKLER